jgi:predicted phosphatase
MASLPKIDSISKLAKFWETHDVTDFADGLEEVTEPVFVRSKGLTVRLLPSDAEALRALAVKRHVPDSVLVAAWIHERVQTG